MGPTESFRLLVVGSSSFGAALLEPDFSTVFSLELAVLALATDCRGRELRRGGDNFAGEAAALKAARRAAVRSEERRVGKECRN